MKERFGLQPQPHPRKAKPHILWLVAGPFVGGILTHWWDLALVDKYYSPHIIADSDLADRDSIIYAAEVAPKLRSHKQIVSLDKGASSWSDGRDQKSPKLDEDHNERYERHQSEDDGECISMHSWQESSFPACNSIHEMDFFSKYRPNGDVSHVTHGGFNELYHYKERYVNSTGSIASTSLALKVLKYEKEYTTHKFGVVRQDAVTLERLTKSPFIYNIYGYCGFAIVVPFVTGGNLDDKLYDWRHGQIEVSSKERLQYAVDMARGLRDLHDIDGDGVPSATHGDLKEHQYLLAEDGRLRLGDFNKGECHLQIRYSRYFKSFLKSFSPMISYVRHD
jgi:hypothetical protein